MRKFCWMAAFVAVTWVMAQEATRADTELVDTETGGAAYASFSDLQGPTYSEDDVAFEAFCDIASVAQPASSQPFLEQASVRALPRPQVAVNTKSAETSHKTTGSNVEVVGPLARAASHRVPFVASLNISDDDDLNPISLSSVTLDADTGADALACWSCDDSGCDGCELAQQRCSGRCGGNCPTCCGVGAHTSRIYGQFLYLRARNAEVAYAVPFDGPLSAGQPVPVQVGDIALLDPDFEPGFRAGVNYALDTVSSVDIRYTLFESLTEHESSTAGPILLRSLVTHPSSATAAQDALAAVGSLEVDFDLIDASYRHLWRCGDVFAANFVVGARYAKLEQQFDVEFVKNGTENVSTDIDFDGAGMRVGLESQRFSCRNQLHVYANGYASFLAGRFRAHYFQEQAFDPSVVDTEWESGRVVPILDLECGVGWTNASGNLRLSGGYLVSAWFNTVTTQDWIDGVRANSFQNLSQAMTFDGLQARVEYRF